MKTLSVLIIHNYYRFKGGEDTVVMHEVAALKKAGADVHELYFRNPQAANSYTRLGRFLSGIFFNLSAYWQVYRLVKKEKIKVVHVHNIFYQASPSVYWAARNAGARVVSTLHNYRLFCLNALFYRNGRQCTACFDKQSFLPGVRKGCFRNSRLQSLFLAASLRLHFFFGSWHKAVDQFIVLNPLMQGYLSGLGINPDRIHLKPNFITDQPFTAYGQRGNHYLVSGRLEPEKGLPEIIDAWKDLPYPLHIAGSGSMQQELQELSVDGITYLGHLDQGGMRKELSSCRGLIFASRLMEGMPLSLIEAMACGVICIAHATDVTRMLVKDGITGFLFDHNDGGQSLKKAVFMLEAMSLAQREKMSEAGRRHYEENFSIKQHLRHISGIYKMNLTLPATESPLAKRIGEAHAIAI